MPVLTRFNSLFLAALLAWGGAASAHEDALETDRPDVVESAKVVGPGRVQLETSLARERSGHGRTASKLWSTPTLLRVGVSEQWELRVETDGHMDQTQAQPPTRQRGTADLTLGAKWQWQTADDETGQPGMAWLLDTGVATGTRAFRGHGWRPALRLVAEWELPHDLSAGIMPGLLLDTNEQGHRYLGGMLAMVLGLELGSGWRTFVEVASEHIASARNGGTGWVVDSGVAYCLSKDMQVDFSLVRGLNHRVPDLAGAVGWSIRF